VSSKTSSLYGEAKTFRIQEATTKRGFITVSSAMSTEKYLKK
jgi:hypothetical protein